MVSYSALVGAASDAWLCPTSVIGGSRKSLSAVPSRRNSGLTETPNPWPYCLPDAASSAGMRQPCVVPGSTVLRMTTTWYEVFARSASPICWQALVKYVRSRLPFLRLGVPTHTSDRSVAATASAGSTVARKRLARTASRSRLGRPGSTIGLRPSLIARTLSASTSTPTTSCPSLANDAAETLPTYPRPKIDSLMRLSIHLVIGGGRRRRLVRCPQFGG